MKKSLTFIFMFLLGLCFTSITVNARTGLVEGLEDGKDYYEVDGTQVVLDLQFDGEGVWGDKNGLYVPGADTKEEDGYLVYSGAASWTQFMIVKPNDEYKNSVLTVTVVAELDGISDFYACARQSYGANARPDIIREPGINNIAYENGKPVSFDLRNGWLGTSDDKSRDSYTINEQGQLVFQFEVITGSKGIAEIGFETYDAVDQLGTIKIDSLVIAKSNFQDVLDLTFDGEGTWGDKDGVYAPNSTLENGKLVYTGAASWTEFMSIKGDPIYTNSVLFVDMAVELVGVTDFYYTARQGWANASPDILREVGVKWVGYDEGGKIKEVTAREGWLNKSDNYSYDTYTIDENGMLNIHSVVVTGEAGLAAIPFGVVGVDTTNATVKVDYIKISKAVEAGSKYYTALWDTSMEDLDTNANPWDVQPIWANTMSWETENPLDGTHSIRVEGSATTDPAWGIQVGGFDTVNEGKRMLKSTGLHYIQFDVDSSDFGWFNIWTESGNDYYAIKYVLGTGWSTEGKVQNFKAQDLGTCWRVSYYVDYTNITTSHNINVFDGTGAILFDNFIVCYVDNSPFVQNGTYDLVGTTDVSLDVALKGQTFSSLVDSEGNVVDSSLYTLSDGKLTLNKSLFAEGKGSYVFQLASTGGARTFEVKQNDNRIAISGVSANISKVYDGTVTIEAVELVLAGINDGDEVVLTADLAFADANVGTEKVVVVSNAQLSGNDASKYILPETIALTGTITAKTLTASFDTAGLTKVYDGSTSANLTVSGVEGVIGSDDVAVVVSSAAFNKAGVDASSISVELALTGAAKDNYVIENVTITEGVSITKKQIQVVANAQTKEEEETDPELTYTVTGLVGSDTLTGALSRAAGEEAGQYDILVGTLSAGENYEIVFTKAILTITEKQVTPDPDPGQTPDPDPGQTPDPDPEPVDGCKLFGFELVMQLVALMAALVCVLHFVRKR